MSEPQAVPCRPRDLDSREGGAASDVRSELLKGLPIRARRFAAQHGHLLSGLFIYGAPGGGRHDRFVPLRLAESASARLGWPLHVIDDAGHVPHLEQPDAFLAALHSALASAHPERTRKP